MRLTFSARGWHSLSWQELIDTTLENKYEGLELYNVHKYDALVGKGGPLNEYNIQATSRFLRNNKLTVPCIDTSLDISSDSKEVMSCILETIKIAAALKSPYVAVKAKADAEEQVYANVEKILPEAERLGITLLISTKGIYADSAKLRSLMNFFANDNLAVLWDSLHTYRDKKETPANTITNLGAYVKHVHLRDLNDDGTYNLPGEGAFPIDDLMRALGSVDYNGFISLVWKPEYISEITNPGIVLPFFSNYMNRFGDTRGKKPTLYLNHDGSGQYVWKKDELISLTFSQILDRMAYEFPDQYAFRYTTLDYTRTYREFKEDVDRFARALMSLGVKHGYKVAVWATNIPAWYIAFWAAAKIGAVLVTVNTAYKIHEAEYLLRQSDTHTLIMIDECKDSNYKEIINELCPEIKKSKPEKPLHCKALPFLRNVITVGFSMPGCLTFEQAMDCCENVSPHELAKMAAEVEVNDVVNMQYTSGTTGFPKGVMLTHYNVVNNGKCIGDRLGLSTADRMMIQVPMFHCFGMVLSMTASMTHGTTLCPLPYFSAKSSLACINQEKITCFNGVPTMFIAMFNHPDYKKTDFSHMRTGIMAGAGCPPELMRRAARDDEMHMSGIVSVYGQTESAPGNTMSSWTDPLDKRCDTVGNAFPHIQCKIIDPETGEILPPGQNGEFCSRGYNTMKGYYKMPDATAAAIDADGWLHSGDLACCDENGYYKITGRLKDMIIRGGENIYPKEIEEFIYTHEDVQDVQVIGVPDKTYGEEVMACVIAKEGSDLTKEKLREYITKRLARHKVPKYIELMDEFPMNAAGKVLKYKMREDAAKRLGL